MSHPSPQEIVVLYCQHAVAAPEDLERAARAVEDLSIRTIQLPCSSKIEVFHLLRWIDQGVDGVVVIGCPEDRCRQLAGNIRARKRVDHARRLIESVGMGAERVGMDHGDALATEDALALARARADAARPLGLNPMKSRKEPML